MKDLSLLQKHLTELHLVRLEMCEEFPQFNHLEALQILHLVRLDKLQSLCSNEASLTFLKLKELKLHNLKNMERWVATEGRGGGEVTFPQLENLVICCCPKLVTLPQTPNLKFVEFTEEKAQLSLLILTYRYMSLLSKIKLEVGDKEAALELDDENVESPLLQLTLFGCKFFFFTSPTQSTIWTWFGKLVSLDILSCDALIYWPEDVFGSLASWKHLYVRWCHNLVGPALVNGEPAPTRGRVLQRLNSLNVLSCDRLEALFDLPPSITEIHIAHCDSLKFTWEEDAESNSVHVEQLGASTLEYCASTSVPKQSLERKNHPLPCLELIEIDACRSLVALPNLPPALKSLRIISCSELCSVSGQLDALNYLYISGCNKLRSLDSLGHLPSLERLSLEWCKCLTSVPGALGSYSALQRLTVKYCPAIDMNPLYKRHQQRLESLEERDLSHAHSRNPREGPKLKDPKTWKYAIPGHRRY
ncbi:hypothetical protein C2845_PM13G04110 [Panicum miliaceum]|uniref:Uncharacterized protein n=1 Tax=Panicum miliaceum TaxID=4540 RepID=A0A3L6RGT8_PANMI|nr:hypothetical protein C2845_PM13G04110 [Panicum miliaceum]